MDLRDIGNLIVYLGTIAGALLAIGVIVRWGVLQPLKKWLRQQLVPPLRRIDAEVSPNGGGSSLRDEIENLGQLQAALAARFEDHLRDHAPPRSP